MRGPAKEEFAGASLRYGNFYGDSRHSCDLIRNGASERVRRPRSSQSLFRASGRFRVFGKESSLSAFCEGASAREGKAGFAQSP